MIYIKNMLYQWEKKTRPIIDIDSWSMKDKSCFIYGSSGSGKSSFVNLLSGITVANQGDVITLGENLSDLSARGRDAFRAKNIGVIYQQFNLLPFLSGMDNILLALNLSHSMNDDVCSRIYPLLDSLKLPISVLKEKPINLSVGQQQRLAIVRTLASKPRLILADEPTSALDNVSRDSFVHTLLQECCKNKCQVILFSHDMTMKHDFDSSVNFEKLNRASYGEKSAD